MLPLCCRLASVNVTLKIEAKYSCETWIDSQGTTPRFILEGRILNTSSSLKLRVSHSYKTHIFVRFNTQGKPKDLEPNSSNHSPKHSTLTRFMNHHQHQHQQQQQLLLLQGKTQVHSVSDHFLPPSAGSSYFSISWRFILRNSLGYPVM